MKQSQSLAAAIASPVGDVTRTLHYITLAMTKHVFTHLGCSRITVGEFFAQVFLIVLLKVKDKII
ncbi:MAG: hypothetical protein ACFB02_20530 [Mastigocoleus sp.]